jgi:hypothetical protein
MIANGYALATKPLRLTMLVCSLLLLSACGSSSSTHPGNASYTQSSSKDRVTAAHAEAPAPRDPVSRGVVVHKPLHGTGGREINDDNPGNADVGHNPYAGQNNPCAYVSQAQAQAIVRRQIEAPQEAPLGPTCIYQPVGAKSMIAVSIEPITFAKIKSNVRNRSRFSIRGHTAYCGDYGQPTTFVPLGDGRVLNVAAPCAIGRLFAADAISRLKA